MVPKMVESLEWLMVVNPAEAQAEQMLKMEYQKYRNQGGTMSYQQFKMAVLQQAQGQGPMAQGQQAPMAQPQMAAWRRKNRLPRW